MARGFTSLLAVVLIAMALLAGSPGFGQIVFPGGGGGYPGGRRGGGYPGGGRQQNPQAGNQDNSTTFSGILRKVEEKDVIVEADDQTITTISTAGSTKYIGTSGGNVKIGDFQPGDHVKVSANQDNKNVYHAVRVTLMTEGTAEEHSMASVAADDPSKPLPGGPRGDSSSSSSDRASGSDKSANSRSESSGDHPTLRRAAGSSGDSAPSASSSSRSSSSDDNDPDRPRLRRADSSSNDTVSNSSSASSSNSTAANSTTAPPNNVGSETVRPRTRRAVSGADDGSPKAEIAPGDSATIAAPAQQASGGDSDRPQLRRSSPTRTADSDAPAVASNSPNERPSIRSGGTLQPTSNGDPFIDDTRDAAFSFTETLPNYVVKQYTTRYATVPNRSGKANWQIQDKVTADVIEENGTEKYKNILVNGKPPVRDVEKTGSWSRGEFSSMQLDVLSPLTSADFHDKRAATIVNRAAFRYEFSVEQRNSHWHMESGGQSYQPGYTGSIWIDKENHRVLRIEMSAQNMPREFPLDQVESAVDYDYVQIGDGKYLLPTHSDSLSCAHGANNCTRNAIEFRDYKKFTADTSITFEADK
jgi:hypothetical protein